MAEAFHYPPELFSLLVDTIPLLCRSKQSVVLFLRGAGVAPEDLEEAERSLKADRNSINKFEIVRNVLTKVNARGDNGLRARREILKRVVEFESFETCWESDQYKAKGLVASIREAVNKKDSFTRMKQERDTERDERAAKQQAERTTAAEKRAKIEDVRQRLSALFGMDDKPQERGKLLEVVLNDLFRVYGIHVREDFRRKDPDTAVVVEQIDGVIELNGQIHLVEMKWLNAPVGISEFSPHLSRLFMRANAHGIFIATNGYAASVMSECRIALSQKTLFLCSLQEFVMLLQRHADLVELLRKKSQSVIVDKNPFLEILS
ncbi:Restriction endonuclease [Candidatus Nitrotoga sp. HW29]|uniref:restriction endonuclease n=1 Tax=Candidatus Nitrotoga sp. HW29 TaxID=2886963 RepID=UPI001EF175B3|nr:restriction endonuclease [Candidatus Nitrotoga sp. HW29]CAH1905829.1 Restriction endonuclease [Candidatus Nitrotoga sp. HW29]